METLFIELERALSVYDSVDVLVIGSGPAGICAALSAAKSGASVLIIEQQNSLGGISTSGMMSHWTGTSSSRIYKEILIKSAEMNEDEFHNKPDIYIDPEKLKRLYFDMLIKNNVKILLYTFACKAITEYGSVKGVVIENKSGRQVVFAKVTIDASGDGDIAADAGVEYITGRESDGKMQPATLMFKIAGVDTETAVFLGSFESTFKTEKGELQALAKKHLEHPCGHVLLYKSTLPGIVTVNMTNITDIDGTNADDLTKAEIICRRQMFQILDFLRKFVPGYESCYIISSGSLIGIRETRHFKGLYTLTESDILASRIFEDYVVERASFNFDVHNITGSGLDETGLQKHFPKTEGYSIPYGCLVPEKIDGLLLAGRNISGTHMAHSNFRVMPICAALGEAAGIAASICVKKDIQPRFVEPIEIRKYL